MSSATNSTPVWADQLLLELRRGRHVLLTGNVADGFPLDENFIGVADLTQLILAQHGCAVIGTHDIVDGMTFATPEQQEWFQRIYSESLGGRNPPSAGGDPGIDEADRRFAEVAARRNTRAFAAPVDALGAARVALAQDDVQVGLVFNLAELTFSGGDAPAQEELRPIALLAHAVRGAAFLKVASGVAPRNAIVLIATAPSRLLAQYVANEPQIATIEVGRPAVAERRTFIAGRAESFYGADAIDGNERKRHADTLARLTEGMRTWDLEALRRTSFTEEAPLTSPRALTSRFALGRRISPWDETTAVLSEAYERLTHDVMGQDVVIRNVCSRLMVARYGVGFEDETGRRHSRPRATFFFAGPTGVGKTELAKSLARLLFEDAGALITFDMTEFRDRASAARLTGSDPGFVGFEQGGQLVNAVRARPFSILLFDEIEKAHPSVLDLFIGILDEGRLTDGHGRTASFADTIVIFTSNAGSDQLSEKRSRGETLEPEAVRELFVRAVREQLTLPPEAGIGRPELLGRLRGGVFGFDLLRSELLDQITGKFLTQWRENVTRVYGVQTEIDERAFFDLVAKRIGDDVLESGARELEPHLRELLEQPLALLAGVQQLPAGATLAIVLGDGKAPTLRVTAGDGTIVGEIPG
jgi:energy-coupling factor transporter ATP-binding protein EcfA2